MADKTTRPEIFTGEFWRPIAWRMAIDLTLLTLAAAALGVPVQGYVLASLSGAAIFLPLLVFMGTILGLRGIVTQNDGRFGYLLASLHLTVQLLMFRIFGLTYGQAITMTIAGFVLAYLVTIIWPTGRFTPKDTPADTALDDSAPSAATGSREGYDL